MVNGEVVHTAATAWTTYIEKERSLPHLDISILTKNRTSFNDQFLVGLSVVYKSNSVEKIGKYLNFNFDESVPYTDDLEIWAQECIEELICTASVINPLNVLMIAENWAPEISIVAIRYWKKLLQFKDEMVNVSLRISAELQMKFCLRCLSFSSTFSILMNCC